MARNLLEPSPDHGRRHQTLDVMSADAAVTIGDPAALLAAYVRWKHARLRRGNPDQLVLRLHYSRGLFEL